MTYVLDPEAVARRATGLIEAFLNERSLVPLGAKHTQTLSEILVERLVKPVLVEACGGVVAESERLRADLAKAHTAIGEWAVGAKTPPWVQPGPCGAQLDYGLGMVAVVCALKHGHAGHHESPTGTSWGSIGGRGVGA